MDFKPKTSGSGPGLGSKKNLGIYAVAALLVLGFAFMGTRLTGLATYSDSLEQQLSAKDGELTACQSVVETASNDLAEANGNLDSARSQLNDCSSNMDSQKQSLDQCNTEKNDLQGFKDSYQGSLDTCQSDRDSYKTQKEAAEASYNTLAENSARDICCTRGLTEAQWSVDNNVISCTGSNTVSCS